MESFDDAGGLPSIGTDSEILVKIKHCQQLENCSMYLPENTLLTPAHCLPGINPNNGLKSGQRDSEIETEVDGINITIRGSKLSAFEKELSKCIQLQNMTTTKTKVDATVTAWFLKIFVHNGWRTVEPVQRVLLEAETETATGRTSGISRAASTTQLTVKRDDVLAGVTVLSASKGVLLELPKSENVAVVFILQCVTAEVNENVPTTMDSETSVPTSTWNIRFGHILPLQSREFAAGRETTFEVDLRGAGESVASDAKPSTTTTTCRTNPAAGDNESTATVSTEPDLGTPAGDSEEFTENVTICPDAARCLSHLAPFGAEFRLSCTVRPSTAEAQSAEQEAVQTAQTNNLAALPSSLPAPTAASALPAEDLAFRSESNTVELPPHVDQTNALARTYDQFNQYAPPQFMRSQPQLNYPQFPFCLPQLFYGPWVNAENYANPLPVVYEPLNPRHFSIPPYIPGVLGQTFASVSTANATGLSRLAYARIYSSDQRLAEVVVEGQHDVSQIRGQEELARELASDLKAGDNKKFRRAPARSFQPILSSTGKEPEIVDPNETDDPVGSFSMKKEIADMLTCNKITFQFLALSVQGREAVQVIYAADVTEPPDWDWVGDGALTDEVPQATNRVLGQLHIRLANVGYRDASIAASRRTMRGRQKRSHVIAMGQPGTTPGFYGGSLSTVLQAAPVASQPTKTIVVRARKMVDTYSQLDEQLKIQRGVFRGPAESSVGPDGAERERMLAKFRMAKQAALASMGDKENTREVPFDRATELDIIDTFRTSVKRENILSMLTGAATLKYALHTSFGSTEFFEFELHNPENQEDHAQELLEPRKGLVLRYVQRICWCGLFTIFRGSLQLITNAPEIWAFKACQNITTPTDDSIFAYNVPLQGNATDTDASPRRNQADIAICLRPNEKVLVPFKYMECSASTVDEFLTVKPKEPIDDRVAAKDRCERTAMVTFKSMRTGKILGQLQLQIYTYPPIIDQTFHFFQPELSYLKRVVRIPPFTQNAGDLPSAGLDAEGRALQKVWTRVSDPGVITESSVVTFGRPIDLLVKVSAGSSPDIRRFLVAVYLDPSQIKPAYIWYWSIQSLRRVDLVTVLGQSAYAGLLIRGDGGSTSADGGRLLTSRRVGVFSSHPLEVSLGTELGTMAGVGESRTLSFLLNSTSVYELKVRVKPKAIGKRKYQINVVDQTSRAVIHSWILCVETKAPEVSRTYDVRIPVYARDDSTGTLNKRLSYTNPYPQAKTLQLESSRPDLVQIKDSRLEVGVGETAQICLKFNVLPSPTTTNCFVFLTDENEKIEDTFAINIEYF
ncbi:Nephrocystin-4 [Sparganum proliferum]